MNIYYNYLKMCKDIIFRFYFNSNFFLWFFFTYIKMSKDLPAKYYQDNKEKLQKNAHERYGSLSKEVREKKGIILLQKI